MKLNELNSSPLKNAQKTLSEGLGSNFKVDSLSKKQTVSMLKKVTAMIAESKSTSSYHKSHTDRGFVKLMVLEQALWARYASFGSQSEPRIIVEAEDIGQAQVVLATKDMVDSIQKMIEQSSDMLVKELPAVVDSIRAQIGANEGQSFNDQASNTLRTLTDALMQAKTAMQQAMDAMTGNGNPAAFSADAGADAAAAAPEEEVPAEDEGEVDISGEFDAPEEPEEEPVPAVGRERR